MAVFTLGVHPLSHGPVDVSASFLGMYYSQHLPSLAKQGLSVASLPPSRLVSVYKFQVGSRIHSITHREVEITSLALAHRRRLTGASSSSIGVPPFWMARIPRPLSPSPTPSLCLDCAVEPEILLTLLFHGRHSSDVPGTDPHRWSPGVACDACSSPRPSVL